MGVQKFLNYCKYVFEDKFRGIIYNSLEPSEEDHVYDKFDVMIGTDENFNIEKLDKNGVLILILYNKIENSNLKDKFSYCRFYSDPQNLYFLGTNSLDMYIPDYISDHKIKTVVVYVFHEFNQNVRFFIQHGIFKSSYIDFILVCSGYEDPLQVPDYVKYINRENVGHDFGAWSHAIYNESLQDKYDYFVLINSSVRGPFIPPWSSDKNWVTIFTRLLDYQTKLVGTTLGIDEHLVHIQSTLLVMDRVGLDIAIQEGIFEQNPISRNKREIVIHKEIGLSQAIMKAGFNIRPIISAYYNTEITPWSVLRSRVHHLNGWYFETNLHPYEIIFIKDNHNINYNRDINLLSINHDSNFDRSINPTVPPDFDWITYINNRPEINEIFKSPEGAIKHWLNFGFYENYILK